MTRPNFETNAETKKGGEIRGEPATYRNVGSNQVQETLIWFVKIYNRSPIARGEGEGGFSYWY